ncbi:MAG: hypothetical protein ABSA49_11590 [Rhizomicrobium sp.]
MMILEATLVAANLFLEMIERRIERPICIHTSPLGSKHDPAVEMRAAVHAKSRTFLGYYDIGFRAAIEVFGYRADEARPHLSRQRFADLDLFP